MNVLNKINEYEKMVSTNMNCCVVLVKATRAPVIVESNIGFNAAMNAVNEWAQKISVLKKNHLAVGGVSVQIYSNDDEAKIREIEIGSPTYKGIECLFEHGAW